jgi:hypothetical protein
MAVLMKDFLRHADYVGNPYLEGVEPPSAAA